VDIRYQIFISSTFLDLESEREIAVQTLMKMNCIPSGMELFPAADIEQFEFIKTVINDCDYYLLIIGGKYGSMTDEGISYTEKEYDYAIEKGMKVIAFLHKTPELLSVKHSEVSKDTIEKLSYFREKVSKGRLVNFWENKDQLAGMIALGITSLIRMYPAIGWVRADKTSTFESLEENNFLRKKNSELEENITKLEKLTSKTNTQRILAGLDTTIEVNIIDTSNNNILVNQSLSWVSILKSITSIVFEPVSEYQVMEGIRTLCIQQSNALDIPMYSRLSYKDFHTIKIQFYALGYITLGTQIDRDDGESYPTWVATDEGKRIILDLVAIKA
jgi:hypothetical protein